MIIIHIIHILPISVGGKKRWSNFCMCVCHRRKQFHDPGREL